MKKIALLSLITIVFISNLISQAPNMMSYQAVIWDGSGNLVAEKMVSIKISILQGSVTGTSVFSETHRIQTNVNGLVSLMIGGGTNATGKIADINWGAGSYFLKTETDPTGIGNYNIVGTTQLISVPYAMHSNTSNNLNTPTPGLPGQVLTVAKDGNPIWVSTLPTVVTTNISNVTSNSAVSGGNVVSDGGSPVSDRGIVWSTIPNPTVSLSTITNNGNGLGIFSSTLNGLVSKSTFYARVYATNSVGTGYGNEISFTTSDITNVMGIPCAGTPTVKDIDGNSYNTVQIGTQCWTKENLRVSKFRDGSIIPLDESGGTTGNSSAQIWSIRSTGARTVFGHNPANFALLGYLYNWYAISDPKGLCPSAWHVPSDAEWTTLTTFLGGESVAGGKMKSISTTYWNLSNVAPTNESGFSTLPGGYRVNDGSFNNINLNAFLWSATELDKNDAWHRYLNYNDNVFVNYFNKSFGA
ncbi:MAG: fibrobacter succinogenes major paralogous domain-containing protein [Saprospiraceae bacterium]